jgi:3-phenylpropionate/cinnamic acid dioxygenase small subunit
VPINENLDPDHHVSVIYDDHIRRAQRVRRLRSDAAWAFVPAPETVRVVSNIEIATVDAVQAGGEVGVRAK